MSDMQSLASAYAGKIDKGNALEKHLGAKMGPLVRDLIIEAYKTGFITHKWGDIGETARGTKTEVYICDSCGETVGNMKGMECPAEHDGRHKMSENRRADRSFRYAVDSAVAAFVSAVRQAPWWTLRMDDDDVDELKTFLERLLLKKNP